MRRNMKKLAAALLTAVCALALSACGSKEPLADEAFYQNMADTSVAFLVSQEAADLEGMVAELDDHFEDFEQQVALYPYFGQTGEKYPYTADAYLSMLKAYESNIDDLGAYVGLKEYEGGEADKDGVTYAAVYSFEKHDMRLTLVFNEDDVIEAVAVDPILTTGEILAKAGMNTILGMGSVFCVLIIICLIIYCFNFIPRIQAMFTKKKEAPAAPAKAVAVEIPKAAPAAPVVEEQVDDLEIIAVITAAVAAAMGTSTDGFTVRSIRRSNSNKWRKA